MISYVAMKTELKARLGNRQDLDTRMDRWLNQAFFEILVNPRFSFFELDTTATFDTVAGTREYSLTGYTNLWFIADVRDMTNQHKLLRTHWSYMDKVVDVSGQPTRYYRYGESIFLDPIPDAIYNVRIRYRRRPNDIGVMSDFEGLGTEWEEKIVTLAACKAFEALKMTQDAAMHKQLYEAMVATMSDVPGLEDLDSETGVAVSLMPRL